jgi:acetoacetyl-CoA synthetase
MLLGKKYPYFLVSLSLMHKHKPLWSPGSKEHENTFMHKFMSTVKGGSFKSYSDLWRWSVTEKDEFWGQFSDFSKILFEKKADSIFNSGDHFTNASWFNGSTLSFSENLLQGAEDHIAIIFQSETGLHREITMGALRAQVASLSKIYQELGLKPGDRIAGYLPNLPETIVAMLAANTIGCVWTACSPDFGAQAVIDRIGQVEPRILISTTSYSFKGKIHDRGDEVKKILAAIPSITTLITVNYLDPKPFTHPINQFSFEKIIRTPSEINYQYFEFDHPLYILYSSGTTGKPKAIIHGQGGTLIQHKKEHLLHTNIKPKDRVFYYSTCSWMMWHWLVSSLSCEATVMLWEGSPTFPDNDALWKYAEKQKINVFGTSAAYIGSQKNIGVQPKLTHDLSCMNTILSTGSPLSDESFRYIYEYIKSDLQLSSIAGGTDLISCFALGNPMLPVYSGEIQCIGLGMDVAILDKGKEVGVNQKGELTCRSPFPSRPVGFWNDTDDKRYLASYFDKLPNIWCHGDFAEITNNNGVIIHGRSDATLNKSGIRIGTAEIYRVVEGISEINDSVAVMLEIKGVEMILLFITINPKSTFSDILKNKIKALLRAKASPHHIPDEIYLVSDIPKTANGKVMEIVVRDIIKTGLSDNWTSIANKDVINEYLVIRDLL